MVDRGAADAFSRRGDLDHEEEAFLPKQHSMQSRDGSKQSLKYYRRIKKLCRGHSRLTFGFALMTAALVVYWMNCDEDIGEEESVTENILALQGSDGSMVTMEDGAEFVYRNKLYVFEYWFRGSDSMISLTHRISGGHWDSTEGSQKAVCQLDIPPLSIPWDYSSMTISGVNLGGYD